jgi:hypothetical protein
MTRSVTSFLLAALFMTTTAAAQGAPAAATSDDPFIWLEEVEGTRALEWVTAHNTATLTELGRDPLFATLESQVLAILNSRDRIVYPTVRGNATVTHVVTNATRVTPPLGTKRVEVVFVPFRIRFANQRWQIVKMFGLGFAVFDVASQSRVSQRN